MVSFLHELVPLVLLASPYWVFFATAWTLLRRAQRGPWFGCGGNRPPPPPLVLPNESVFWKRRFSPLLLPQWALALLVFLGSLVFGVYGAWRTLRVYDAGNTLWLAAMLLHVAHSALLFVWPLLIFHLNSPNLAAAFITLEAAAAAAVDVLFWALFGSGAAAYTWVSPTVYLVYTLLLVYLTTLQIDDAVRASTRP